uniref:SMI1/KNR4 family protein n=1 Tax=Streptomyces polyasparticus TaxID=2767826 RepID=UPI001F1D538B|nr:SMI1/KNR4 family protein [Streptomyces polyasparticus]
MGLLWEANWERLAEPGGFVAGQAGRWGFSLPLSPSRPRPGRAAQVKDRPDKFDVMRELSGLVADAGVEEIALMAEISAGGRAVLRLMEPNTAVSAGIGSAHPGALILVEGAVPEPWRRLPEPSPGAVPAPSADPVELERLLRERLPRDVGASEAEIAAAEARLGVELPAELMALYRVTGAPRRASGPEQRYEDLEQQAMAVGCELFPLDRVYVADAASRPAPWQHGATAAVHTAPDAAVQQLVGSPGWIVFGDTGGGDRIALDLTPGPGGHIGQVIVIDHEQNAGAGLVAASLTDLVCRRTSRGGGGTEGPSPVAHVNRACLQSIEAAAHPGLEVLSLGVWSGEPFRLAPVLGLPRLRTLSAYPGTLADPLEIGQLEHLEFLELAPEDWRVLLDAKAVPPSLKACAVETRQHHHPLEITELSNEILALWGRPPITWTTLEGDLAG